MTCGQVTTRAGRQAHDDNNDFTAAMTELIRASRIHIPPVCIRSSVIRLPLTKESHLGSSCRWSRKSCHIIDFLYGVPSDNRVHVS